MPLFVCWSFVFFACFFSFAPVVKKRHCQEPMTRYNSSAKITYRLYRFTLIERVYCNYSCVHTTDGSITPPYKRPPDIHTMNFPVLFFFLLFWAFIGWLPSLSHDVVFNRIGDAFKHDGKTRRFVFSSLTFSLPKVTEHKFIFQQFIEAFSIDVSYFQPLMDSLYGIYFVFFLSLLVRMTKWRKDSHRMANDAITTWLSSTLT